MNKELKRVSNPKEKLKPTAFPADRSPSFLFELAFSEHSIHKK
jgi:hypothetical protein